jgi:hypothetical protein
MAGGLTKPLSYVVFRFRTYLWLGRGLPSIRRGRVKAMAHVRASPFVPMQTMRSLVVATDSSRAPSSTACQRQQLLRFASAPRCCVCVCGRAAPKSSLSSWACLRSEPTTKKGVVKKTVAEVQNKSRYPSIEKESPVRLHSTGSASCVRRRGHSGSATDQTKEQASPPSTLSRESRFERRGRIGDCAVPIVHRIRIELEPTLYNVGTSSGPLARCIDHWGSEDRPSVPLTRSIVRIPG